MLRFVLELLGALAAIGAGVALALRVRDRLRGDDGRPFLLIALDSLWIATCLLVPTLGWAALLAVAPPLTVAAYVFAASHVGIFTVATALSSERAPTGTDPMARTERRA